MEEPKIVIVGAGFGGLFCAKGLKDVKADITLIDRQNHHLFQPLLYQVATGFLGINDVAFPVRRLFRNSCNVKILMQEAVSIDAANGFVYTDNSKHRFDYLVIATGSSYSYFGHDEWRDHTATLKTLQDAIELRQSILASFEKAEVSTSQTEKTRLLRYIVIGGGPTGVEIAGAIADVVNYALEREFRNIKKDDVRIVLLEAGPRILSGFNESLSTYAKRTLQAKGVEVLCNNAVLHIENGRVTTSTQSIESDIVIWAAGVQATHVGQWLGVPYNNNGSIPVREDLSIEGHDNIFVLGDASHLIQNGKPLPALASVAKQQGKYVAQAIRARLENRSYKIFHYRDYGTMATIGRNAAIMQIDNFRLSGWPAWIIWGLVHILFLTGFRNQISVFITWLWTYLTYGMGSRIIIRQKGEGK